jgi:GNAT superfamily N-acetyltransferase
MAHLRDLGARRDLQITAISSIGRRNDKAMTKWLIHGSPYHDADRGAGPAGTGLFLALKHQLLEFPPSRLRALSFLPISQDNRHPRRRMLDYTLVTTKATYRPITPVDIPGFIHLVTRCRGEEPSLPPVAPDRILATVRELDRHKKEGSVLVFEKDECLVGYCILLNRWSPTLGGTTLDIDEMYVAPEQQEHGIAADFVSLLVKVAPAECTAIRWEVRRGDRKSLALSRKLGFSDTGRSVVTVDVVHG